MAAPPKILSLTIAALVGSSLNAAPVGSDQPNVDARLRRVVLTKQSLQTTLAIKQDLRQKGYEPLSGYPFETDWHNQLKSFGRPDIRKTFIQRRFTAEKYINQMWAVATYCGMESIKATDDPQKNREACRSNKRLVNLIMN